MSDETPRLRLAELVSLQELNAVTWNEALAQIDALVDLYLLGQFVNTPPSAPQDGDAYLIGGAPAGDWSGQPYKIAAALDGAWRFYIPFNGLRAFVAPSATFIVYRNGTWVDDNSLISAAEVSIASAATCDLDAAGALFVQVTGTTTITSFGTGANKLRTVRFAQGLTLTHNATRLILLGGASRTTAAGDVGVYASDASGNWRERAYFRAASNPGDAATKSGVETFANKTFSGATAFPNGTQISASGAVQSGNYTAPAGMVTSLDPVTGRSLWPYATGSFADMLAFKTVTRLEYCTTAAGAWVDGNSADAQCLLDNTQATSLEVAAATYKGFRVTVDAGYYLGTDMLVLEQLWENPGGCAPCTLKVETSADLSTWTVVKDVTALTPFGSGSSNTYYVGLLEHSDRHYWRITILRTDAGS